MPDLLGHNVRFKREALFKVIDEFEDGTVLIGELNPNTATPIRPEAAVGRIETLRVSAEKLEKVE
jgi:hypothetical protein